MLKYFFLLFLINIINCSIDNRNIITGNTIIDNSLYAYLFYIFYSYMDTVGVLVLKDGTWLSTMHVSYIKESAVDQHVICAKSDDKGKTWHHFVDIEPCNPYGPPSGRASPLLTPNGRIYVFYNYNYKNITKDLHNVPIVNAFVGSEFYRYSDDNGATWSERHMIPIETKGIDYRNEFRGEVLEGYGVGKAVIQDNTVYVQYGKRTNVPPNTTAVEIQDFLLVSPDLLTKPEAPTWYTYPEASEGCTSENSINAHEGDIVFYGKNIYFTIRSTNGFVSVSTSSDGGKTFTNDQYAYYYKVDKKPNKNEKKSDRKLVNSDSPLSPRYIGKGRYLLPFYNTPGDSYGGRNPLWISGGVEADNTILWSQPELLLYSKYSDAFAYPDLYVVGDEYYISESNKTIARTHHIEKSLIENLFKQKYQTVLI